MIVNVSDFRFQISDALYYIASLMSILRIGWVLPFSTILLANLPARPPLVEVHEGRGAGLGEWLLCQPVSDAHQVHRGRNEDVLQMRFSQADVACASQVTAAYALQQRALNTCALGKGFGLFSCSGGLQSLVLGLGTHGHGPAIAANQPESSLATNNSRSVVGV